MDKLNQLISECKCGISLFVNDHKDCYQTARERIYDKKETFGEAITASDEIKQKMIELDTIIYLSFYPDTPIGSVDIYHYDVNMAIDQALAYIKDLRQNRNDK